MHQEKVSIIIPIYNVESYLGACLESVISQTYTNIEIILVNDGSTDCSLNICKLYQKKDNRINILHQENYGVFIARKKGLQLASGDYVCFIDSDDTVDVKFIETLMCYAGQADIVTSGCTREEKDGRITVRQDAFQPGIYQGSEQMLYVYNNMIFFENSMKDGLLPYIFGKLFKRSNALEIMNSINYPLKIYEDRAFILSYVHKNKSICITNHILYQYRFRPESTMHTQHKDYLGTLNEYYLILNENFSNGIYTKDLQLKLQKFISNRLIRATTFMDFSWEAETLIYFHPFSDLSLWKKIVIYGAGAVGKNYYREISKEFLKENIYWTDKNWEHISKKIPLVQPIDKLLQFEFDIIILAVKYEYHAIEMKNYLLTLGIPQDKIIWKSPILLNEF